MTLLASTAIAAPPPFAAPASGVPLSLARERAARVGNLRYVVALTIPVERAAPIAGRLEAHFTLADAAAPLAFDFAVPASRLRAVDVNGQALAPALVNDHVVLPAAHLRQGANSVAFTFDAGDGPLNRHDDFLYSLFVPARASHALPVFDQPDLKARWTLRLDVPAAWTAVSNGAEAARTTDGGRLRIDFAETAPLPPYLFAFAAGRFAVETLAIAPGAPPMRMFHRETDVDKLARNRIAITRQHVDALTWLTDYTAIPYRYGKFDIVLLPAFQFGGMEHAGAIFYNADSLLLDTSATQAQALRRANLIAHETAHMWFGDLVTMRWFDDVWLKEVFANFMAAKMVNPQFPDVDHTLRFHHQHYPGAYAVDRTAGANPIRQPLDNLAEAGSLYGAIIYLKSPVVMRQLELRLGETVLRDGLRAWLARHADGNASWQDLVTLLAAGGDADLPAWSRAWVETRGRPRIEVHVDAGAVRFTVRDPSGAARTWPQRIELAIGTADGIQRHTVDLTGSATLSLDPARGAPRFVLPSSGGLAYGDIVLPPRELDALATALPALPTALDRGAALITLWESLLEGRLAPTAMHALLARALPLEADELNLDRMLVQQQELFWRHTPAAERAARAAQWEPVLWAGLEHAASARGKATWFGALMRTAVTPATLARLDRVWKREEKLAGLPLSESDETELALELCLRDGRLARLDAQAARIDNADRKARLAFLRPALSADAHERTALFERLRSPQHRQREAWVLDAVGYLHHPLRDEAALDEALQALAMLPELQRTGDIFLPKRWAESVLAGYASPAAARRVRALVDALPADYPPRLRWVLLASADTLLRRP